MTRQKNPVDPSSRLRTLCAVALITLLGAGLVFAHDFILGGGTSPGPPPKPGGGQGPRDHNPAGEPRVWDSTDPVDVGIGDFVFSRRDLVLTGPGAIPLEVTFTYRSMSAMNLQYGYGWDMSYNRRLRKLADGNVIALRGDNTTFEFTMTGPQTYAAPTNEFASLVENANGTFTLVSKHGDTENYDIDGNLVSQVDRSGNALTFTYDPAGPLPVMGPSRFFVNQTTGVIAKDHRLTSITDTAGRVVTFAYDANGRLASMSWAGRTITYGYDAQGNLASVTKPPTPGAPAGSTTTYTYDADHNLLTEADPLGLTIISNTYDADGRVSSQTWGGGTTTIDYFDSNGNPAGPNPVAFTETIDRNGNRVRYDFDGSGRIARIEEFTDGMPPGEPPSYVTTVTYDQNGNRTRVAYPRGNAVEFTYDARGNVTEVRRKDIGVAAGQNHPTDVVTTFTYDATFDLPLSMTDPEGRTTSYGYDASGNLTTITLPSAGGGTDQVLFAYSPAGQVQTIIDPNGSTTAYTYDAAGNMTQAVRGVGTPEAATTAFAYDAVGNITAVTDPNGNTFRYAYDAQDQLVRVVAPAPLNYQTHFVYDAGGNLVHQDEQIALAGGRRPDPGTTHPHDGWRSTVFAYDALGRTTAVTNDLGLQGTFGYDLNGNLVSATDEMGRTTTWSYDERNLLSGVQDAGGNTTSYVHDGNGNLVSFVDAKGNVTAYVFDGFDRPVRTTYPDGTFEVRSHDRTGHLVSLTTPAGANLTFSWDARGRLVSRTTPDETTAFTYDAGGRLLSASDADATLTWTYDALSRKLTETMDVSGGSGPATVGFHYDPGGRVTRLDYPGGSSVDYTYDALDRIARVTGMGGQVAVSLETDGISRLKGISRNNGVVTSYRVDAADQVVETVHQGPAGLLQRIRDGYDRAGQHVSRSDASGRHKFSYDAVGRLTATARPGGFPFPSTTYTHDPAGNLTSKVTPQGTTAFAANSMNQYTTVGGVAFSYDVNGALLSDGTRTHLYNTEDRLVQTQAGTDTVELRYGPLGRIVEKSVNGVPTRFVYDGSRTLAELDAAGNVARRFVFERDLDLPLAMTAPLHYHLHDGFANVTGLTDAAGALVETYAYDRGGEVATPSALGNPYYFRSARYHPETGLYEGTFHDPRIQRELQRRGVDDADLRSSQQIGAVILRSQSGRGGRATQPPGDGLGNGATPETEPLPGNANPFGRTGGAPTGGSRVRDPSRQSANPAQARPGQANAGGLTSSTNVLLGVEIDRRNYITWRFPSDRADPRRDRERLDSSRRITSTRGTPKDRPSRLTFRSGLRRYSVYSRRFLERIRACRRRPGPGSGGDGELLRLTVDDALLDHLGRLGKDLPYAAVHGERGGELLIRSNHFAQFINRWVSSTTSGR